MKRQMPVKIITPTNSRAYSEQKTGWEVYSLFFEPLPLLAMRNNNDKHDKYKPKTDWHSTFSWRNDANLGNAVHLTLSLLQKWGAFRGLTKKERLSLIKTALSRIPPIVESLSYKLWGLNVRRIDDIRPGSSKYVPFLTTLARAVGKVSALKGNRHPNPMFGSKVLHFLIPEFFPVWDNAIIDQRCLATLEQQSSPDSIRKKLQGSAEQAYADYLHLFLTEMDSITVAEYRKAEKACLDRIDPQARGAVSEIINYHYDDVSTIVFEICLMGKCL
jgi:hypothetical protein